MLPTPASGITPTPKHIQAAQPCAECAHPMKDLGYWTHSGRVPVWRCISRDCCRSIFTPVKVPSVIGSL